MCGVPIERVHHNKGTKSLGRELTRTWADDFSAIKKLCWEMGIDEIIPVPTNLIVVSEWVRLKCKYGCQRYGKSWCCPPETPTPDSVRSILKEYEFGLILSGMISNPFFYRNDQRKRRIQVKLWKASVTIERQLFLRGYYKVFSLISENCALCKTCLYPQACAFPEERRPSLEAFSIDIFETLRKVGKEWKIYQKKLEPYRHYSIILVQ